MALGQQHVAEDTAQHVLPPVTEDALGCGVEFDDAPSPSTLITPSNAASTVARSRAAPRTSSRSRSSRSLTSRPTPSA